MPFQIRDIWTNAVFQLREVTLMILLSDSPCCERDSKLTSKKTIWCSDVDWDHSVRSTALQER
jgi:hypothetical protein